jgi:hypothetical protein
MLLVARVDGDDDRRAAGESARLPRLRIERGPVGGRVDLQHDHGLSCGHCGDRRRERLTGRWPAQREDDVRVLQDLFGRRAGHQLR